MNLPELIQQLYGIFTLTGLYSFEFVDATRNPITEIFFMIPPKTKSVEEPTRSSTIPTLGGNYNLDAGNGTKNITIGGELCFPYVGSPDNPIAPDNTNLEHTLNGFDEFFKLRWMLLRYRDYTMCRNQKLTIPISLLSKSPQILALYTAVSKRMSKKIGALYDQVQLIFHDYDMDDHYYCRVAKFSSNQSDSKYLAISYTIQIECTEPATKYNISGGETAKPETNQLVYDFTNLLGDINFAEYLDSIQADIGYNSNILVNAEIVSSQIDKIAEENNNIQAGKTTAATNIPTYVNTLLNAVTYAMADFVSTFLTPAQQVQYDAGTLTLDEIVSPDLLNFYNTLQKIKLYAISLQGVVNCIPLQNELRFYANANNYVLTSEQFDNEDAIKIENDTSFFYYTVMNGDTARIIALRMLHDQEKYINILQINNISENDFIDGTLVGEKIKIPIISNVMSAGENNLVYESNIDDLNNFVYGKDIGTGLNGELKISSSGDLADIQGSENVIAQLQNRVTALKGSLNIFNPNWGAVAMDDGNMPYLVKVHRYLNDVVEQIQSDPRVESVFMDLSKLKFSGETISSSIKVYLINSEDFKEVTI